MEHYPCEVCKKVFLINIEQSVATIAVKCNDLNDLDFNLLKHKNDFWYCILCTSEMLPFSILFPKDI